MLVVGARGFAKEILEILHQLDLLDNLVFYDDVNADIPEKLYDQFPVLTSISQAEHYFRVIDTRFVLGVGSPHARHKLATKLMNLGGVVTTVLSPKSNIGHFGTTIGVGSTVLTGTSITNDVMIGKCVLINKNCTIGHDCTIGDFSEISPGVCVGGHTVLEAFVSVGLGAIILPGITVGSNTVIGAGAIVTKDIPSGVVAFGAPARVVRENLT